jgi:DNA-binding NtrC family response regulator
MRTSSPQIPVAPAADIAYRRILVADDSETTRVQLQKLLEASLPVHVATTPDGTGALDALCEQRYSLIITDLNMPRLDGLALIGEIQKRGLPVTVIVTTGHASVENAVEAMRMGAYDFLTKPLDFEHLRLVVERALEQRRLQDEVASLRDQLGRLFSFHHVLSKSPKMHAAFELVRHVAPTASTVLIQGETGTGKEMVARAIHEASDRCNGPMVAVNCAALPETLLESELFGHEKGSFTSAVGQRKGRFELAHKGTLFLDEIGDVPASMQAKLLRVLQERRFERVGGTTTVEVDVRVITATHRNLLRLAREGRFREDLYYRLNVVKIELPPLRERLEDIPLLVTHFTEKYARAGAATKQVSPECMSLLLGHNWPGNVRELENAIERACVTATGDTIGPEHLPPDVQKPSPRRRSSLLDLSMPLPKIQRRLERAYLRKALRESGGNLRRCAGLCGLSERKLAAMLAAHGLRPTTPSEE